MDKKITNNVVPIFSKERERINLFKDVYRNQNIKCFEPFELSDQRKEELNNNKFLIAEELRETINQQLSAIYELDYLEGTFIYEGKSNSEIEVALTKTTLKFFNMIYRFFTIRMGISIILSINCQEYTVKELESIYPKFIGKVSKYLLKISTKEAIDKYLIRKGDELLNLKEVLKPNGNKFIEQEAIKFLEMGNIFPLEKVHYYIEVEQKQTYSYGNMFTNVVDDEFGNPLESNIYIIWDDKYILKLSEKYMNANISAKLFQGFSISTNPNTNITTMVPKNELENHGIHSVFGKKKFEKFEIFLIEDTQYLELVLDSILDLKTEEIIEELEAIIFEYGSIVIDGDNIFYFSQNSQKNTIEVVVRNSEDIEYRFEFSNETGLVEYLCTDILLAEDIVSMLKSNVLDMNSYTLESRLSNNLKFIDKSFRSMKKILSIMEFNDLVDNLTSNIPYYKFLVHFVTRLHEKSNFEILFGYFKDIEYHVQLTKELFEYSESSSGELNFENRNST